MFILIIFSVFHFIYESILLPMFRMEIRYKLFEQRDKLRNLKIDNPDKIDDEVFYLLEDTISVVINRLPFLSISSKYDASKEYETNNAFKKRVESTIKTIQESNNDDIKEINNRILQISTVAFILNGGGWIYILLPILILLFVFAFITSSFNGIKNRLNKAVYKLTYASENDFSKFSHI